jgi:hypothetical protein
MQLSIIFSNCYLHLMGLKWKGPKADWLTDFDLERSQLLQFWRLAIEKRKSHNEYKWHLDEVLFFLLPFLRAISTWMKDLIFKTDNSKWEMWRIRILFGYFCRILFSLTINEACCKTMFPDSIQLQQNESQCEQFYIIQKRQILHFVNSSQYFFASNEMWVTTLVAFDAFKSLERTNGSC